MNHFDRFTVQEHEQNVASLDGRRLTEVRYHPLSLVDEPGVEEWDFGTWHQPTMGVELQYGPDAVFSAIWDRSFGTEYSVELRAGSIDEFLVPEARRPVELTAHPRWAPFIGPALEASAVWADGGADGRVPAGLALSGDSAELWIIAACPTTWPPTDHFSVGTDDVMVVFDAGHPVLQQTL